jgi:archaellum component FlaC
MAEKAIDSTTKILRKIQTELVELRKEIRELRRENSARFDSLDEYMAGAVATATEARGIAERMKERVKRLEDRR